MCMSLDIFSDVIHFSVTVTAFCNQNCSYCHFYEKKINERKNISRELFSAYMRLICELKSKNPHVFYRFSGGEPLTLGDEMFYLAQKGIEITKTQPYVLTNGKLINANTLAQSEGLIGAYVVSLENPFDIDSGAIDTEELVQKFQDFKDAKTPLLPGIVIVKNSQFCNIEAIADYFYNKIGTIPSLAELSYGSWESPTEKELSDLYANVKNVVRKYAPRVRLKLFPYILPEFLHPDTGMREYITELDYDNKYSLSLDQENDIDLFCKKVYAQLSRSYVPYNCSSENCDWKDGCREVKWLWRKQTNSISIEQKAKDYCRMKKTLCEAYYDAVR